MTTSHGNIDYSISNKTQAHRASGVPIPDIQYAHFNEPFPLESGQSLSSLRIAYHTFGELDESRSNVVWIVHALTANSNPTEWWPEIVGQDKYVSPDKYFIVCANCIGSPYGSTSPLDLDISTGLIYYHDFPLITQRDQASAFEKLRLHLGINSIHLVIGASLGGQQVLEWSIIAPNAIKQQLLIATNAVHSSWGIAFNESQRMAIRADQTWNDRKDDAGLQGLAAARSIALLSYRTYAGYVRTQDDKRNTLDNFRAVTYQQYQGEKLIRRFNAFSYMTLSKSMDSHNIGRNKSTIEEVLNGIKVKTHIIGIDSDILFPLAEQAFLYSHIPRSRFHTISSDLGHDGFLTEGSTVGRIITGILG